jgi:3-oxoacyl-[acyl-carrier-protein] synthase-3
MGSSINVGILGVGAYLPPEVRRNDWWPPSTVAKWQKRASRLMARGIDSTQATTEGARAVLEAMSKYVADPFGGSLERRVAAADLRASDIEALACREAIVRAGVSSAEIDFVLGYSVVPDYLATPNASAVHKKLELRSSCFVSSIDVACNSFMQQLTYAKALVENGTCRYGLLFQSSLWTRIVTGREVYSPWVGDGATAVVVGPVSPKRGIVAVRHDADGTNINAMVLGVPGKRWHDEGRNLWYPANINASNHMVLSLADRCRQSITALLEQAGLGTRDVTYYGSHQPMPWFRPVTQHYAGLAHAKSVDTFQATGSMSAVNVPYGLHVAEREGRLKDGDLAVFFAGGSGETWSSVALRWGR